MSGRRGPNYEDVAGSGVWLENNIFMTRDRRQHSAPGGLLTPPDNLLHFIAHICREIFAEFTN